MHVKHVSNYPELRFERNCEGDDLQQEFNFLRAEHFTQKMLTLGLISRYEYLLIMRENRKTFPTFLASII